jgi:uncharacterized membrane protein YfcA
MLAVANLAATIIFIATGMVYWALCVPMLLGGIVGGHFGAKLGLVMSARVIRVWTLLVTIATTIVFFWRAYG